MTITIDQIYILRKPGIFCIKNELYKLAYISHSSCILKTLGTLLYKPELDFQLQSIETCKIELLQEIKGRSTRLAYLSYYKAQLEQQGYTLVGRSPNSTQYKLRIDLYEDFRNKTSTPLAYVSLKSPRSTKEVIGVFNSLQEAEEWVLSTYGSLTPVCPVPKYCINELTMLYLQM